jgi:hypothetical protein
LSSLLSGSINCELLNVFSLAYMHLYVYYCGDCLFTSGRTGPLRDSAVVQKCIYVDRFLSSNNPHMKEPLCISLLASLESSRGGHGITRGAFFLKGSGWGWKSDGVGPTNRSTKSIGLTSVRCTQTTTATRQLRNHFLVRLMSQGTFKAVACDNRYFRSHACLSVPSAGAS